MYKKGFGIQELFPVNSVGIVTARDQFTIHETPQKLKGTILEFISLDNESARKRFNLGKDVRDWSVAGARKDLVPNPDKNPQPDFSKIVPIQYRPFDTRYTYYTGQSKGFHCMPRGNVMRHFLVGDNIGVMVCRQQKTDGFFHCLIHENIVESSYVSNKTSEIGYSFPLYIYPFDDSSERRSNLNYEIVKTIEAITGLCFSEEKFEDTNTFAPLDILDYVYAVLYSPGYREKYKEFLKIDFPCVPFPADAKQFYTLASYGAALREIHMLGSVTPSTDIALYPITGSNTIDRMVYKDKNVWINKEQYFDTVPEEVWNFRIGGYQSAQKWLKDRQGRTLDFDEIEHYQKIVHALYLTQSIQRQIDYAL